MGSIITLLQNWLSVFPPSFQPYVFYALAIILIVILIRVLRGVILLSIAVSLILFTLYLSSALFHFPLRF